MLYLLNILYFKAICIDDFEEGVEVKTILCFHKFHSECINKWLKENSTCPVCKQEQK